MAISLGLVGFFLYLDQTYTPLAVVVCVIIYNASFGFLWGIPDANARTAKPVFRIPSEAGLLKLAFLPGFGPVALPCRDAVLAESVGAYTRFSAVRHAS